MTTTKASKLIKAEIHRECIIADHRKLNATIDKTLRFLVKDKVRNARHDLLQKPLPELFEELYEKQITPMEAAIRLTDIYVAMEKNGN